MRPERFSRRADGFSQPVERFAAASGNYSLRIHGSLSLDPFRVMEPGTENRWPLVAIVGPTASGKSALALKLAEELGGEILNCDSIQVYRHLDIGSGKVPAEWRQRVPHHLLDIALPDEDFAAGDYRRIAEEVLREVRGRRRLPFVVGGDGALPASAPGGIVRIAGPLRESQASARGFGGKQRASLSSPYPGPAGCAFGGIDRAERRAEGDSGT